MTVNTSITVMLVEDHPSYRRTIEKILANSIGVELTSMFGAAETALSHLATIDREDCPQVILLDLNLAGIGRLDA